MHVTRCMRDERGQAAYEVHVRQCWLFGGDRGQNSSAVNYLARSGCSFIATGTVE